MSSILDVREVPCPFHFHKARQKIATLQKGEELEIWSTRLGAAELEKNLPEEGVAIVETALEENVFKVKVKKT